MIARIAKSFLSLILWLLVTITALISPKTFAYDVQTKAKATYNERGFASPTAQLAVTVLPVKVIGQKAMVELAMKNNLPEKVESARAVCFLLDDKGKMAGQATKWIIGQNKIGLESGATNTFNFVIASNQQFTSTNLTARISFTKIVLEGNKLADPNKDVIISAATLKQ
jgi:hypothetical protein